MQLMRMNVYSRDHVDSEYVSYMAVDRKADQFIGNKQTDRQTHTHTHIHTDIHTYIHTYSQLYILA